MPVILSMTQYRLFLSHITQRYKEVKMEKNIFLQHIENHALEILRF